jgi:DNA helicase-2/ATP-dependent DNA helicase PcrA
VTPPLMESNGQGKVFVEGMRVRHATYGAGRIVEVSGHGALRRVKIRFATAGERSFIADKVTLEIVSGGK